MDRRRMSGRTDEGARESYSSSGADACVVRCAMHCIRKLCLVFSDLTNCMMNLR